MDGSDQFYSVSAFLLHMELNHRSAYYYFILHHFLACVLTPHASLIVVTDKDKPWDLMVGGGHWI